MSIDWEVWARIELANVAQFAALFAEVDPEELRHERRWLPDGSWLDGGWRLATPCLAEREAMFARVKKLALAALSAETLTGLPQVSWEETNVRTAEFVRWARDRKLPVPPRLAAFYPTENSDTPTPGVATKPLEPADDIVWGMREVSLRLAKLLNRLPPSERTVDRWLRDEGIEKVRRGGRVGVSAAELRRLRPPSTR